MRFDSRRSLLRRLLGALGAALLTPLAVGALTAVFFAPVARADDSEPAPTTPAATTPDAPPPDPYQAPPRTQPKPKPAATHAP